MDDKQIITIIGNVGVGKTTALPLVATALNADIIRADEFFQTNPFRDKFLKDIPRWGFTNELYLVHKRLSLIKRSLLQSDKSTVIIDSGLLMSWVYTKSHYLSGKITLDEWIFFQEVFFEWSHFALNTTLLYLTADTSTLLKRITHRKRDFELKQYKRAYLLELEIGLRDLCATFAGKVKNIISLDTTSLNLLSSKKDKAFFSTYIKETIQSA